VSVPERVALVSPYALSVPGGVQTQVRAMARDLASRGIDVTVCSPGLVDEQLTSAGIAHVAVGRILSLPANGSRAPITLSARAARTFASVASTQRAGVVHVHEPFAPVSSYTVLGQHRRPIVGTFHRGGGGPAYAAGRPLIRRLAASLDVVTAVSDRAAETIATVSVLRPVVLFNGIEITEIDAARPWPTDAPTVLFVGRHEERKGLGVLLEAFAAIELPIECWVMGQGPQSDQLRRRFASDPRISWLGAGDDAEKFSRMRGAHVLCVPSQGGESFGLVPLEGMAAGIAVVASDIPGYREATGGHATLVAPGDAPALAAALRRALEKPSTNKRLAEARAHAERWSVRSLVDRYMPLYEEAMHHFDGATA